MNLVKVNQVLDWIVRIVLIVVSILLINSSLELKSERSKRTKLEAELAGCIYSKETFYRRLTLKEQIYRDTVTINDTILGAEGLNSRTKPVEDYMWIVLDTASLINRIKQQVLDSIDSSEVTDD